MGRWITHSLGEAMSVSNKSLTKSSSIQFRKSDDFPTLLTIKEAAELANNSPEFWRKKILNREINFVKIGSSVRIPLEEIQKIIINIPSISTNKNESECEG